MGAVQVAENGDARRLVGVRGVAAVGMLINAYKKL